MRAQPNLPGTLPAPALARAQSLKAAEVLAAARATLDGLTEAVTVCAEMLEESEDERSAAAADFAADEGAPAHARYLETVEVVHQRRASLAAARAARREGRKAVRAAERGRDATDEALLAIAAGQRTN